MSLDSAYYRSQVYWKVGLTFLPDWMKTVQLSLPDNNCSLESNVWLLFTQSRAFFSFFFFFFQTQIWVSKAKGWVESVQSQKTQIIDAFLLCFFPHFKQNNHQLKEALSLGLVQTHSHQMVSWVISNMNAVIIFWDVYISIQAEGKSCN